MESESVVGMQQKRLRWPWVFENVHAVALVNILAKIARSGRKGRKLHTSGD